MATGCLPMRDIEATPCRLPNGAEQFAAEFLASRPAVAHDAFARADDGDTEAVEDRLQLRVTAVEAAAWPTGPLQVPDHLFPLRPVLQINSQYGFASRILP